LHGVEKKQKTAAKKGNVSALKQQPSEQPALALNVSQPGALLLN
jgi:hypothetical protein